MVRDFTQAKKEEIDKALELIEDREWKPFMAWCSGRAAGFGEWADRLGISSYTRQIDNYQNKILEVNDDTRNQVNATFGGVLEADRGYADIFRRHAETVREQIRTVQTMLQVMQVANKSGAGIKVMVHGINPQLEGSCAERLESGRRVLLSYLIARGITDTAKQQEICDFIMENQPYMLANLYMADFCGSDDAGETYNLIEEYYIKYKAQMAFINYLNENEVMDPVEQQRLYDLIIENQPNMFTSLSISDFYGSGDPDKENNPIINYYNSHCFGDYPYPVAYIDGIIKAYETHNMVDGRFVLDNGGRTIGYGHDVLPGEDFTSGLSESEALELAITDLDKKYGLVITCIKEINEMTGMNINKKDFSQNEMIFFIDFAYNRGKGLAKRPELSRDQPHSSLALLIIAVSESDDERIIKILKEEVYNQEGIYYKGLEIRRMDQYEILKKGDYERNDNMERGVW